MFFASGLRAYGDLESTNTVNLSSLKKKDTRDLQITADELSFDNDTGWAEAKGRVIVIKDGQKLQAVYARINTETDDVYAAGNVRLQYAGGQWEGEELSGNFGTKEWEIGESAGSSKPFRIIKSEGAKGQTNGFFVIAGATMTTCTNEYPNCHYHIQTRKVAIKPGDRLKGWGGKFYLGNIPLLYVPYWTADLRPDFGWMMAPGHSSRLGTYMLTSYKYRMSPIFRGETHVDYMSERGVAFGQDIKWGLSEGIPLFGLKRGAGNGDIETYFINDQKPIDSDEDAATADIEESRHRILLRNNYSFTARDYTMLNASYMSDTDVLEDFFEDEYRVYHTPDNFFIYGHNGDEYTISLAARFRLNDFFDGINKLPELSVDFMPQQIGGTDFFYEGRTAMANLEQVYDVGKTNKQDYSVFRFDTWHEISRPEKFFGFLNVIPRASYRGTYYSETRFTSNSMTVVTSTLTNNVVDAFGLQQQVVTTKNVTNSNQTVYDQGAEYRNVFGLGAEFSFKAFRQWGDDIKPRRHVVEPYANYTFVPEPNLLQEDIYQFDGVDSKGEENWLRIGMRNKLQKKKKRALGYSPHDILDVDVFTRYNLDPAEGVDSMTDVWGDIEWSPAHRFIVQARARYNLQDSELNTFNIRGSGAVADTLRTSMEWRYTVDQSSLLFGEMSLFPGRRGWSPSAYARYEIEERRAEEAGFYLRRTYDCMVFRTGLRIHPGYTRSDGSEVDDEYRATVEFWLRAFPEYGMKQKPSKYSTTDRF